MEARAVADAKAKAVAATSGDAPAWGAELVAMAEMCNEGVEAACTALGQQDEAELA